MQSKGLAAISVDLEDWYQGLELPLESWGSYEKRIQIGTEVLLEIFDKNSVKATFFALGIVAKEHPKILQKIADAGHEIGSHSLFHKKIYELTPKQFKSEEIESKDLIEQVIGSRIFGFRAPYFSITNQSLWALEVLSELGYEYDSSISPVKTWRYGIKGVSEGIYEIENGMYEFTPSTMSVFGKKLGVGGAYMRLLPLAFTKRALSSGARGLYLHPWELDPHHPRINISYLPRFTHYVNLKSTKAKLSYLVETFRFLPIKAVIEAERKIKRFKPLTFDDLAQGRL